jgi:hypothetical protein
MNDTFFWYVARSAGLVAWVFLVASVVIGASASGRLVKRRGAQRWLLDVHPFIVNVGLAMVVLHIGAALGDHYIGLRLQDVVVPFGARWNSGAMSWGVLSLWLLAAVEITSLLRARIPKRLWHGIHFSSYLATWAVSLHAVYAGTDLQNRVVSIGALALVVTATYISIKRAMSNRKRATPATAVRPAPVRQLRPPVGVTMRAYPTTPPLLETAQRAYASRPPSTTMTEPVTNDEAAEARNRHAPMISLG